MRILLYGEYSGVHKYLQVGLRALGHECVIASSGDSWKSINGDVTLGSSSKTFIGRVSRKVVPILKAHGLTGYDVIQFMSTHEYSMHPLFRKYIEFLIRKNKKSFLLSGGCDPIFYQGIGSTGLKYHPCEGCLKYDYKICPTKMNHWEEWQNKMNDLVDGIIPISESYALLYRDHLNARKMIRLPVDINSLQFSENIVNNKIVFFHGINRYGFKGSYLIEEAFNIIKKKYSNDVEMIIGGRMPFAEYTKYLRNVNVVVDQTFGYGLGMNALISMALGRVTMTRYEESLFASDVPAVNIQPTVENIVSNIERIIDEKEKIEDVSRNSRKFVETFHDCRIIAKNYLNEWSRV